MNLTILFTHLKIILLQCFQFSVFNKISCIQTDLKKRTCVEIPKPVYAWIISGTKSKTTPKICLLVSH